MHPKLMELIQRKLIWELKSQHMDYKQTLKGMYSSSKSIIKTFSQKNDSW